VATAAAASAVTEARWPGRGMRLPQRDWADGGAQALRDHRRGAADEAAAARRVQTTTTFSGSCRQRYERRW